MFPVLIEFGRILFGSIWSGFLLPGEKAKTETWSDVVKGLKTKDELETTNSDESENRSEETESVRMFDSDTLTQPRAKWKRRQQKKRQHRDNKEAEKGHVSKQADRKG